MVMEWITRSDFSGRIEGVMSALNGGNSGEIHSAPDGRLSCEILSGALGYPHEDMRLAVLPADEGVDLNLLRKRHGDEFHADPFNH